MKKIGFLFVIFCILIFPSCNSSINNSGSPDMFDIIINYDYTAEELCIIGEDCTYTRGIAGMFCDKDALFLCVTSENKIHICNYDGSVIHSIGELGIAPGEFNHPTALSVYENNIYVLDSNNHRIQVFDESNSILRSIDLVDFGDSNRSYYNSIAIDGDGSVYVSSCSPRVDNSNVYYISEDHDFEPQIVLSSFYGSLYSQYGVVYALSNMEAFRSDKEEGFESGQNYLYELKEMAVANKIQFPYKYSPTCFLVKGDSVICVSYTFTTLDRFSKNGEYLETIYDFDDNGRFITYISEINDTYYVSYFKSGGIYKISKVGS